MERSFEEQDKASECHARPREWSFDLRPSRRLYKVPMRLRLLALAISFSNKGPQTPHQLTRFRSFATTTAAATAESRPHRRYSGEMDSHAPAPSGDSGGTWWTDEKHLHFLDSLESSFLRAMLVRRSNRHVLRLDRHLPDSSDSTSDSPLPRTRKRRTSRDICRLGGPAAKKPRHSRRSCNLPCDDDQVVPQIAKRAADEEEEDPTNAQASQARPT